MYQVQIYGVYFNIFLCDIVFYVFFLNYILNIIISYRINIMCLNLVYVFLSFRLYCKLCVYVIFLEVVKFELALNVFEKQGLSDYKDKG